MKDLIVDENVFLKLEISKLFVEYTLDFLYIQDLDCLFAVSTIMFPTIDNPFLKFSGFVINNYRITNEQAQQLRNKLKQRMEKPMQEFTMQAEKWFFLKDKYAIENLNKRF